MGETHGFARLLSLQRTRWYYMDSQDGKQKPEISKDRPGKSPFGPSPGRTDKAFVPLCGNRAGELSPTNRGERIAARIGFRGVTGE